MDFTGKLYPFLISQALVWLPMLAGHRLRKTGRDVEMPARFIHSLSLIVLTPLVCTLGIWKLDRTLDGWLRVPLAYGLLLLISTVLAVPVSRRIFRSPRSIGTHTLMFPISNIAHTMAGFITLLLLGQAAYPFNAILQLPLYITIFLVLMPLAAHYGGHHDGKTFMQTWMHTIFSPLAMPLVAVGVGLGLNYGKVPMAHFWVVLLQWMVYIATAIVMFGMGLRLHFRRAWRLRRVLQWVCLMKFLIHPAIALALCGLLGLRGLPAGALFIASCAPVGVVTVQFSTLFDLDEDMANAGYLLTTAIFMLLVLPFLIWFVHMPMFQH